MKTSISWVSWTHITSLIKSISPKYMKLIDENPNISEQCTEISSFSTFLVIGAWWFFNEFDFSFFNFQIFGGISILFYNTHYVSQTYSKKCCSVLFHSTVIQDNFGAGEKKRLNLDLIITWVMGKVLISTL